MSMDHMIPTMSNITTSFPDKLIYKIGSTAEIPTRWEISWPISVHENCCASDTSETVYSKVRDKLKKVFIITVWKLIRGEPFGPDILPPADSHVIKPTVIHYPTQRCWAETAIVLPKAKEGSARTECHRDRTLAANKITIFWFTVRPVMWKSSRRKKLDPNFLPWARFHTVRLTAAVDMLAWYIANTETGVAVINRGCT